MDSNRIEKLNSLIQQQIGEILKDTEDVAAESSGALVTVSRVETSGDARWAKVWISIVSGGSGNNKSAPDERDNSEKDERIFQAIKKNLYEIQGELNRHLKMKMTPRLQFFLDTAPRYAQHIDELIKKIHDEE
jgi:ribosome-binding factor A